MALHDSSPNERIVSLAPDATSILVAIGARDQIVGVSRWCKEVADVGRLPRLGDCWKLDVREVARLKPTLIIGSVPFAAEAVEQILKLPATFVALNPRSLADIYANITRLGRLTDRRVQAAKLALRMQLHFRAIHGRAHQSKSRPRVYAEAWSNPRIASPPWVAELIDFAGGKMIAPAGQRVTDAQVAKGAPDVIILAWTATGDRAKPSQVLGNTRWQRVPAVMNRRVVVIRDELLNTPGPPLIDGATQLLRAIHPELEP
jgi:iron complex transport system substrate-binding protein